MPAATENSLRISQILTDLVAGSGVAYGLERSFKLAHGRLLGARLLLGIRKANLGPSADSQLIKVCKQLLMPSELLSELELRCACSTYVHIGSEGVGEHSSLKVYLEFPWRARLGVGVKFVGYKWRIGSVGPGVRTTYLWYPELTGGEMFRRVTSSFGLEPSGPAVTAACRFLDLALSRVDSSDVVYVETTEAGTPRQSFDINGYKACVTMDTLRDGFWEAAEAYGVANDEFKLLLDAGGPTACGHVAAGLDRHGAEFLSVYYGVEFLRTEALSAATDGGSTDEAD